MNDMNVASYVKRPDEYKALKFDTAESYKMMARWLHDTGMQHVRWTERFGFIDGPYIEFISFDKSHKVFPGMWVVISEKDGSTEVLHDVAFKQKYMPDLLVASEELGYDKHDEIVAVNENPEITTRSSSERLLEQLAKLLNSYSLENASGTPDFILAKYLLGCLNSFNEGVMQRAKWRSESPTPFGDAVVNPEA